MLSRVAAGRGTLHQGAHCGLAGCWLLLCNRLCALYLLSTAAGVCFLLNLPALLSVFLVGCVLSRVAAENGKLSQGAHCWLAGCWFLLRNHLCALYLLTVAVDVCFLLR